MKTRTTLGGMRRNVGVTISAHQVIARGVIYQGDFLPPGDAGTGEWYAELKITLAIGGGIERASWQAKVRYPSGKEAVRHLLTDLQTDGGFPVQDLFEAAEPQIREQIQRFEELDR